MTSIFIKPLKAYWRSLILYLFIPLLLGGFFVAFSQGSQAALDPCSGNQPPVAVIEPTNPIIDLGDTIIFSASGSTDPDANSRSGDRFSRIRSRSRSGSKPVLVYNWVVPAFDIFYEGKTFEFTPPRAGWFSVDLKVTDDCGAVDWVSISLQVIDVQQEEPKVDLVVDDIYFINEKDNRTNLIAVDICNIGTKDFSSWDTYQELGYDQNIAYPLEIGDKGITFLTAQSLAAGECYTLSVPIWAIGMDPYSEAGEYEVTVTADYWEGSSFHTNAIDELDETNNQLTKTVRISALDNVLWYTGYLAGELNRSLTMIVGYNFIKDFQVLIGPIRRVYEKYSSKINIHLIYASKYRTRSGHHTAARAVECLEDQDKQFVLDLLETMEQNIWPYGFFADSWALYASENISGSGFNSDLFKDCVNLLRNSQKVYDQQNYADYLDLLAGQIILQNHDDGTSQLFEVSEINYEDLEQAVKDSLGIVDPQVPARGSFGRFDRTSSRR